MNATYPNSPGFKGQADTGRKSAQRIAGKAALQRKQILATLVKPATHDETAAMIRPKDMNDVEFETFKRGIRSRCSELKEQGKIKATDQRRENVSGHSAVVWQAIVPVEHEPWVTVIVPRPKTTTATQQELI